nr:hypothetical protein [Tanacetum cinerariifolium]
MSGITICSPQCALLPIELTNDEIRKSKAYKEYYAITTGEAAPKPKASVRRTRSSSDTFTTPPTAAASPRLIASAKNSIDDEGDDNEEKDDDDNDEDEGDDGEEGNDDDDEHKVARGDDKDDDEEGGDDDEYAEETRDEESFDPIPQTPKSNDDEGNGEEGLGLNVGGEEGYIEEEEEDELYRDVNINQGRGLQTTLDVEDSHVTLTPVHPDGQQQSSSVSLQFVTSMLNPTLDVGMESIFETTSQLDVQTPTSVSPLPVSAPTITPSTIATITTTSQAPILPTTVLSTIIQNLKNFGSLFYFDDRLRLLETNFSEAMQTNQFAGAVSAIPRTIQRFMDQQMNEEVKVAIQIQSNRLRKEAQRENDEFLKTVDENMKNIIKETSYVVAADLSEMELKNILIEKMEGNKSIQRSDEQRNLYKALVDAYESDKIILDTYEETTRGQREAKKARSQSQQALQRKLLPGVLAGLNKGPDLDSVGKRACFSRGAYADYLSDGSALPSRISELAKQADTRSSFNELMDTPLDFSNFLINQLKVDTLTPELLAGPTYELMKGSCKSLIELEYHLEEVFKATIDQLDWVNPKGQQYPHNLLKPLSLISNNRSRRVILFENFINNDLEYLRGGASSRKYTTFITKTKGVSHWGRKRQQFYCFAVNREASRDVYFKRRITAVTELKILEWHSYKHLDWITMRRDDDKLYKFKEEEEVQVPAQDDVVQEHVIEEIATEVVPPTPTSPSPPSPVIPSLPPHQSPCPPQPQAAEENANAAQQLEIIKLKARVKKLERLNKGRISVDIDEGVELVVDQEKDAEINGRHADTQAEIYNIDLDHSSKVLSMQEDTEVQEAVEVMTTAKLITEVVTAAATQVAAASTPIPAAKPAAKPKVLKIVAAPAGLTMKRKGVVIRDPEEELHVDTPAETPTVKDKGKGILIEDPKPMKKKDQIEMDAEYAKKLKEELEKEHEEAYKQIDWNAAFEHVQAKET